MQLEQVTQLLLGRLLQGADLGASGVVDEHVDATVPGDEVIDHTGGVHIRDIEGQCLGLPRVGGDQLLQGLRSPGRRNDTVSAAQRRSGDSAPEAAAGTGDQPYSRRAAHEVLLLRASWRTRCSVIGGTMAGCPNSR
jgi:hypothetical protein